MDSNQNTETFKLSEPENVDDAFGDDDDGFDLLLSQIDTTEAVQSSSTFTILSKKTLHQSNGVPPKSTLELPTTSRGTYIHLKKKFDLTKKYVGVSEMSFLTGQDRTPKFAGQVLPDSTENQIGNCVAGDFCQY